MADANFTPEELELLDEMLANLKAIKRHLTNTQKREKTEEARFDFTATLNGKNNKLSNLASAGEKNSGAALRLVNLTPLQPIPEIESTMVMEHKEDQIEDLVDASVNLVLSKGAAQVTETLNNCGLGAEIEDQSLKPLILDIHSTEAPLEQNYASTKVESEQLISLHIPAPHQQLDWKPTPSDFHNFVLQCPHWIVMMGMDSIESILVQTDEHQHMLLAPVSPRLPPKPPDVSYGTVGFAEPSHSSFKGNQSFVSNYRPLSHSFFSQSVLNLNIHMKVPMEEKPFPAWSWSVEQCLKEYGVKLDKGLSTYEVDKSRENYGWNELAKEEGKPLWQLVLKQFDDMLVNILLLAAFISFVLAYFDGSESGHEAYVEPLVILLILVLNAIVGVWQEHNAEKALKALRELQCEYGKVFRDGNLVPDLPARELVPGDVVELHVGDKVPADMRVAALKTSTLRVEQSSLTGEAMPILKSTNPKFLDDCELQAKENMVFAGTTVVNGSCVCIVITTGMNNEIGKIQNQIHEASMEDSDTPLKKKLDEFGGRLTTAIGVVCLVVWVINYKKFLSRDIMDGWPSNIQISFGKCIYYFKIAVAIAVAEIPEGLPAVIITCLALGTRKMAQKDAIVRKLPSIETLRCTTVICSDKSGTLTTNQMSVIEFLTLGGKTNASRVINIEGTTSNPSDGGIVDWTCYNMDVNLVAMAEICVVCNDDGIHFDDRFFRATGLPTEAALKVLVEKMGVPDLKSRNKIRDTQLANNMIGYNTVKLGCCEWWNKRSKKVTTLEFDRIRESMSVIVREPDGQNRLLVKGVVESLLERSSHVQLADGSLVPIDERCRELLLQRLLEMSLKGLCCLGMAYKDDLGEFSDYYADTHPARKKLLHCNESIKQHLILWEGLDDFHATWEDHSALVKAYPDFNLEDKVVFNGGGIVTNTNRAHKANETTRGVNESTENTAHEEHVTADSLHPDVRKSGRT